MYKAWDNIFSDLIPKSDKLKEIMKKFVTACRADEAVLLEKNTLMQGLVIFLQLRVRREKY